MRAWIQDFLLRKNQGIMAGFLVVGLVIFFGLISYLISALFHASSTGSNDSKNQLLRAKTLVEESQKLSSNPDAFDHSIEEAVVILSDLKKKDLYLKETDALFSRIEAMKKEIYDIQTVDLKSRKSIIAFNPIDISPL